LEANRLAKILYETVPAGGQRDPNNAAIVAQVIADGGLKGWKFVTIVADFEQNYVVFEKPTAERRG
jgi:hypothetical protein